MINSKEVRFLFQFFINICLVIGALLITGLNNDFNIMSVNLTIVMGVILLISNIFYGLIFDTLEYLNTKPKLYLKIANYVVGFCAWLISSIACIFAFKEVSNIVPYELALGQLFTFEFPIMLVLNYLGTQGKIKQGYLAYLSLGSVILSLVLSLINAYLGYIFKIENIFIYIPLILSVIFLIVSLIYIYKSKIEVEKA